MHFTREPGAAWHPDVAPVKVARFALGSTPHADLYLSAAHALYLSGLLIPVQHLINGRSITANAHADALTLTHYHIELATHDAVIAEGAAAETYAGNDRLILLTASTSPRSSSTNDGERHIAKGKRCRWAF